MSTRKLHYMSGLIISIFIGLHLFNHVYGILGAEKHIYMMNVMRLFYRNIFVETILLTSVFIQVVSGLRLFRTKRHTAISGFDKLHIWTGLYLAAFLIIHLSAVFGLCLTALIFYSLTNNFQGVTIPAAYHILIGK
jgi:hypothetical protein